MVSADITPPIVADLGKASREWVTELRGGAGPLVDDVEEAMRCIRSTGELARENRVFVPIVVVYTEEE